MIGQRIKNFREIKGYSISELAKLACVSKSYLSLIERDLKINPSLQFLTKIAKSLETSIDSILGNQNPVTEVDPELVREWEDLVLVAIKEGLSKEEFSNYLKYLKFEKWKNNNK